MTDLHTHILPGMDDGAATVAESLTMLEKEYSQGVRTVVLTPHFYPHREELERFLTRREQAMNELKQAIAARSPEQLPLPEIRVGAEVLWRSDLVELDRLNELCIEGTRNLLLELPFTPWSRTMIDLLYDLTGCTGITPVIAHLERYISIQPKSLVQEVLRLGVPVQISAGILLHPLMRRAAMKLLKKGQGHLLASDCHGCEERVPDLAAGMGVVRRKLGEQTVWDLCDCAERLVRP